MNEGKEDIRQQVPNARDWVLMTLQSICFTGQVVVCILFCNWLVPGRITCFGWAVFVLAMYAGWAARIAFQRASKAGTGHDWLHSTALVRSGIYGLARHPMYLPFMLISLGLELLSQHRLNLALGAVLMVLIIEGVVDYGYTASSLQWCAGRWHRWCSSPT